MKTTSVISCRSMLVCIALIILVLQSPGVKGQGRVLINEYLAWPGNTCPTTSEYIELYNFGPGPMNIGCFVLTDGDYAITIPANTIILPGEFYLISGQSTIPLVCGSANPSVPVDLNWNACSNCTSSPIPTTGDGFMTDGGGGSEQLVLFDADLNIVDAIVRDTPEISSTITTAASNGCSSHTFNLNSMSIRYERVGESQGRANSFARKVNGGCGWLKDTQQSPGSDNNTSGNTPQFTASVTVVQPVDCSEKGMASIQILNADYTSVFPMKYLLGKDVDSNFVYDELDYYNSGIDSVPTHIELYGLESGLYKVVVETRDGCDLQALNFNILNCVSVPLYPVERKAFGIDHYNESLVIHSIRNNGIDLKFQKVSGSTDQLRILDVMGNVLYQEEHLLRRGHSNITIPVSITAGRNYIIQWRNGHSGALRNLKFSRYQ